MYTPHVRPIAALTSLPSHDNNNNNNDTLASALRGDGVDATRTRTRRYENDDVDVDDDDAGAEILCSARRLSTATRSAAMYSSRQHATGHGHASTRITTTARRRHARERNTAGSSSGDDVADMTSAAAATAAAACTATRDTACSVAAVITDGGVEVGVALCTLPGLALHVAQYVDSSAYAKTLTLLHTRDPVEVLVAHTAVDDACTHTLLRHFAHDMTFTAVQRRYFHSEAGVRRLHALRSTSDVAASIDDTDRYLAVAAANALLLYMERVNDMQLLPHTLRVRFVVLERYVDISRAAARALHMLRPAHDDDDDDDGGGGGGGEGGSSASVQQPSSLPCHASSRGGTMTTTTTTTTTTTLLLHALPRACTAMGRRLLAASLLQPLSDRVAIQLRHDVVAWLLASPHALCNNSNSSSGGSAVRLSRLRQLLQQPTLVRYDLEQLTAMLAQRPCSVAAQQRHAQQRLYALLCLCDAIDALQRLHDMLASMLQPMTSVAAAAAAAAAAEQAQPYTHTQAGSCSDDDNDDDDDAASTPQHPVLLRSIVQTLQRCALPQLAQTLSSYLDDAVRHTILSSQRQQQQQTYAPRSHVHAPSSSPQSSLLLASPTTTRTRVRRGGGGDEVLFALLRLCFVVRARPNSALDAARSGLAAAIDGVSTYHAQLCATYGLTSLRLEADALRLYHFSYSAAEEARASRAPFRDKYAGGEHDALLLRALQSQRQRPRGHTTNTSPDARDDDDDDDSDASTATTTTTMRSASASMPPSPRRRVADVATAQRTADTSTTTTRQQQQQTQRRGKRARGVYNATSPVASSPPLFALPPPPPPHDTGNGSYHRRRALRAMARRRVRCTTDVLDVHCARAAQFATAVLREEDAAVRPLLSRLRASLGTLQAMAEAVALLDMLVCFALYARAHDGVRPVLVESDDDDDNNNDDDDCRRCRTTDPYNTAPTPRVYAYDNDSNNNNNNSDDDDATAATRARRGSVYVLQDARHPSQQTCTRVVPAATTRAAALARNHHHHNNINNESAHVLAVTTAAAAMLPVCNTVIWRRGVRVLVVTGPNTAGKTTLLRQVGQHVVLAQSGCYVPATAARLRLVDGIGTHMLCDALPSVTQSAFKHELSELATLSHATTPRSLLLIDELGRCTRTGDGVALVCATLRFVCERRAYALCTTHFAHVTTLARTLSGVDNVHFGCDALGLDVVHNNDNNNNKSSNDDDDDVWQRRRESRRLRGGACDASEYGVALASKMQLLPSIVDEARRLLLLRRRRQPMTQ